MTNRQNSLRLKLDEVDMIAYASETEPVCSFYYDDTIDNDETIERTLAIVCRVNVYPKMLEALEMAEEQLALYCYADDGRDKDARRALKKVRGAIANAKGGAL